MTRLLSEIGHAIQEIAPDSSFCYLKELQIHSELPIY